MADPKPVEVPPQEEVKTQEEGKNPEKTTPKLFGSGIKTGTAPKFGTKPFGKFSSTPFSQPQPQQDTQAVDDSHIEAAPSAVDQVDPDEGEETLFHEKSMLYRFDKTNNDWKERGVGFMKILKNKESSRCRVLMRRNQTFRVCSNHFILPHMELKPHTGNDRALIWNAVDFADGAESHDTLSVRFRTAEIAASFKKAFETGREINALLLKQEESQNPEQK